MRWIRLKQNEMGDIVGVEPKIFLYIFDVGVMILVFLFCLAALLAWPLFAVLNYLKGRADREEEGR